MFGFFRRLFAKTLFLEAGAALLFFGSLIHNEALFQHGERALAELQSQGYQGPTVAEPVRIYPGKTDGPFSGVHAGSWRPGVITLRQQPQGVFGSEVYLRHELLHEASFRTCKGNLPLWAEEAAAIHFSGELPADVSIKAISEPSLEHLRERVRAGARLDEESYTALSHLLNLHGWPQTPCSVSPAIAKALQPLSAAAKQDFSYLLISLLSGRILEAKGDLQERYPPGSLLKIPYAASLNEAASEVVGAELSASDTGKLLARRQAFNIDRYRLLISMIADAPLGERVAPQEAASKNQTFWRRYLGERDEAGLFPLEANLQELALMLRAALLSTPERFSGLSQNGITPGSTLYERPETEKKIVNKLRALCKTGTVSDERGQPLAGHLMVAWPKENPVYLAIFRKTGVPGSAVLRPAALVLKEWEKRWPSSFGEVRVRLLSLVPATSWKAYEPCPVLPLREHEKLVEKASLCGRFQIISSAKGGRPERIVWGVLETRSEADAVVLETDPFTFADQVLESEADDLSGEAKAALRAVIVWNGVHGGHRHPETEALCDSTHCMVFQGVLPGKTEKRPDPIEPRLIALLNGIAKKQQGDWLSFSEGGAEKWTKQLSFTEIERLVNEPRVHDIRRERKRSGEIVIHLMYPENEEVVPCEVFRNRMKLLSCPAVIERDEPGHLWRFEGIGKGHGLGLSVARARILSQTGYDAAKIIEDAYGAGLGGGSVASE